MGYFLDGTGLGRVWTKIKDTFVKKSGDTMTGALYINLDQDVGLNQNGSLIIGTKTSTNLAFDANEIMARSNGAASQLYLNNEGGNVIMIGGGTGSVGIGTSSPSYKLHVVGDMYSSAAHIANTYVRSNAGNIYAGSASGSQCHLQYDSTNECMKFLFD